MRAFFLAFAAFAAMPAAAADIVARPFVLDSADPERRRFGALEYRGGLRLSGGGLGGLSSLLVEDGVATMLSDRGRWFRLRLDVGEGGWLDGATMIDRGALAGTDGVPLEDKSEADSECMTRWGGGIVAGFERRHRLWHYAPGLSSLPRPLETPRQLADLGDNQGIEALATLPDGRLLMIAENGPDGLSPAWIGRPGAWTAFAYRREGRFEPTGADSLPDGRVVVVERRYVPLFAVSVRIVILDPASIQPGSAVGGEELMRLEPPLPIDNFEGIAVARDGAGIMLYLLSDDNFSPFQSNLLLAFLWPGGG